MSTQPTREVEGTELPAPGRWVIDPKHSSVEFVARHILTRVRGRFRDFSGTIEVDEVPERSRVEVRIDAASIDTGTPDRDQHLRSPDFLDVERFPSITYRSTALRPLGGTRFALDGELTIRDVTRPVTLDAELVGVHADPWGNTLASFSARTTLAREDWGVTWNVVIETGGLLVGKTVEVELEVEAVLQQ